MFPTLSSIIEYLTGVKVALPVQTYGLFMALAFWCSYLVFRSEFYRKEKQGLVLPYERRPLSAVTKKLLRVIGVALAFLTGYKILYCLKNYRLFVLNPEQFVFSSDGNIIGGLVAVACLVAFWWWIRRKPEPATDRVHPYKETDRMMLWCACFGFFGAVLFAKLEYLETLLKDPVSFFSTYHGMAFLGGFLFGAGIYLVRTTRMGIPLLVATDIGSPGILLASGIGRMGCHLSGDGDWGQVNYTPKPSWLSWVPDWGWAYRYPHNSIHEGAYIEGCSGSYCTQLEYPVYPSSLYESLICLSMFLCLWLMRHRIKTNGIMFFLFLLGIGSERFLMEFIRLNKKYCVGGVCLTQAQYISLAFIVMGIGGLIFLRRNSANLQTATR